MSILGKTKNSMLTS